MKMNNNHNSSCGFAEETVTYLYGEMNEGEKAKFEKHLSLCSHCEEELAAFASAHSSILNWKAKEFDPLTSPIIEIPYETAPKTVKNIEISRSWLGSLRELFSLSPVKLATAACALLVAGFGLMFFVSDFSSSNEMADLKNANSVVTAPAAKGEKIIAPEIPSEEVVRKENETDNSVKEENPQLNPDQIKSQKRVSPSEIVKTQNASKRLRNSTTVKSPNNFEIKPETIEARIQQAPRLNNLPEEVEDRSLRLTDLLADLDTE